MNENDNSIPITEAPKKPDQEQQQQLAKKTIDEIKEGKNSDETQIIINKLTKLYEFKEKYPPEINIFGAQEAITEEEKKDLTEREKINQELKDLFGNFGGFVYATWENTNHSKSE
jgi:glycerophosphoryl diester phosphodiesterase